MRMDPVLVLFFPYLKMINSLACQVKNCASCQEDGKICNRCLDGYTLNNKNECHLNTNNPNPNPNPNPNQANQSCRTML